MSRLFGHFIPAFLKRFDHKLLLNYPIVWASRIHYVLFFGLGVLGFMLFKLLIMPIEPKDIPEIGNLFLVSAIPFVIVLFLWIWSAKTFRAEKGFGETSPKDQLQEVLLIIAGVVFLALGPVTYVKSYEQKVKSLIPKEQFTEDLKTLNNGAVYLWQQGHIIDDSKDISKYVLISPDDYDFPDKDQLPSWGDALGLKETNLTYFGGLQISMCAKVFQQYTGYRLNFDHIKQEKLPIIKKHPNQEKEVDLTRFDFSLTYRELATLQTQIDNVSDILYGSSFFREGGFWSSYGFLLLFTSLTFSLFLVVKWKYFWLSVVVGLGGIIAITMFSTLFTALAYLFKSTPDSGYFLPGIVYLAILGAALITGLKAQKFRFLSIFSLSLATLLTIFLPSHIWTLIQSIFGSLGVHPAMGSVSSWTMWSMLLGALLSVWLWVDVYRPHLIRLQTEPQKS